MFQLVRNAKITFNFIDAFNFRKTNKAVLEYIDDQINVDIPSYKGDKGDTGDPGPSLIFEYEVATTADLPDPITLTDNEIGHWWRVTGSTSAWIWNGEALIEVADWIGVTGATGPAPTIDMGAVTDGATAEASLTPGAPGHYALNLQLPKGDTGATGAAGATGPSSGILTAVDYQAAAGAVAGDVLILSPTSGKVTTVPRGGAGWYGIPASSFAGASVTVGSNTTRVQLAQVTVSAQPTDWFPKVSGHVRVRGGQSTRVDIEVRLGDPTTGTLIAYGAGLLGSAWFPVTVNPEFDTAMVPTGSVGRIAAGVSGPGSTIYVVAVKAEGSWDAWQTSATHAHVDIECRKAS